MRIAVYQPQLLPLMHYWNRIASVDKFILLDDAQFTKKSEGGEALQNYTFVKSPQGDKRKVTLPVTHDGNRYEIRHKPVAKDWMSHMRMELVAIYGNQPFFTEIVDALFFSSPSTLGDITTSWTFCIAEKLFGDDERIRCNDGEVQGKASEWMLNFCKHYNADTYVCGKAAYDQYLDKKAFADAGIKIEVQNWKCPEYPQGKHAFIPNLSILDPLVRIGWEATRELVR